MSAAARRVTSVPGKWKVNTKTRRTAPSEHSEQVALMEWTALVRGRYPELDFLYAVPNGGFRQPATARKLKEEGVKPGVPDLCLPVARSGFHGFYLEMKAADGRLSDIQVRWLTALRSHGYAACVAYSFDQARQLLVDYLEDRLSGDKLNDIRKKGEG